MKRFRVFNAEISQLINLQRIQFSRTKLVLVYTPLNIKPVLFQTIQFNISKAGFFFAHMGRVFTNCPEDLGSIPGRVLPKTFKMVLDTSLLNTQQYKVRLKGKVEQSLERISALPYTPLK